MKNKNYNKWFKIKHAYDNYIKNEMRKITKNFNEGDVVDYYILNKKKIKKIKAVIKTIDFDKQKGESFVIIKETDNLITNIDDFVKKDSLKEYTIYSENIDHIKKVDLKINNKITHLNQKIKEISENKDINEKEKERKIKKLQEQILLQQNKCEHVFVCQSISNNITEEEKKENSNGIKIVYVCKLCGKKVEIVP